MVLIYFCAVSQKIFTEFFLCFTGDTVKFLFNYRIMKPLFGFFPFTDSIL